MTYLASFHDGQVRDHGNAPLRRGWQVDRVKNATLPWLGGEVKNLTLPIGPVECADPP